ncbi:hypothetical protein AL514_00255 (plasmid) [Staphylococcus epidermidis]|nr:hypothetical protein AL514_00255 [Staphylococcus epidermidis]
MLLIFRVSYSGSVAKLENIANYVHIALSFYAMIIVRNLAKNLECFYDFFRKNSHEIYKKIMYILLNSTVIAFILLLIVKLIFDFLF